MEDAALIWIHWYWVGFFVAFGVFLMTQRRNFGSVKAACCTFRIGCEHADMEGRLRAAIERRQQAEGAPAPLGVYMGGASIAAGAVLAFTRLPVGVLYPLFCFCMALISAAAYQRLRNVQPLRVAVLSMRNSDAVVPSYWFAISALASMSVLAYATMPQFRIGSIVVCCSSLLATAIAWKLTELPAIFSGVDIPAEQIVDDRVRFYRSSGCLLFAIVQGFIFCSQTLVAANPAQLAAYFLTGIGCLAFAIWFVRRIRGKVQLA